MWLFDLRKPFALDGKEQFNCKVCHSRDCNSLGAPRILLGHFPVAYSPGQIFPDHIASWCIPLPENCR